MQPSAKTVMACSSMPSWKLPVGSPSLPTPRLPVPRPTEPFVVEHFGRSKPGKISAQRLGLLTLPFGDGTRLMT